MRRARRGKPPRQLVLHPGGERAGLAGGATSLISAELWDDRGRVHPVLRGLSDAAGRDDDERTDWENRVVAAARWYANAVASGWPSEALVSCMTALEALFVRDRKVRAKGAVIAKRVSEGWVFRRRTRKSQEKWLRELYESRNEAIHEGRRYVEDLEVERLMDITAQAVTWGAWHLSRQHAESGAACSTFDEVMGHETQIRKQGGENKPE